MRDARGFERSAVVGLIVEADDCSHPHLLEDRDVVFGGEVGRLDRSRPTPCSSLLGS